MVQPTRHCPAATRDTRYNRPITTRPRPGMQKIRVWKRPRRSSSPTVNPTTPCLLNCVLKHGTTDPSLPTCNQGHTVQPTHHHPAETRDAENHSLEKTSQVIKSNRQPNATVPAQMCPEAWYNQPITVHLRPGTQGTTDPSSPSQDQGCRKSQLGKDLEGHQVQPPTQHHHAF